MRLIDECRQSTGSLKPAQAQQIVKRVAQIVSAAHSATPKLVHRDLKPSNILVERRPAGKIILRVTDFGIGGLAAEQDVGAIPLGVASGEHGLGADGLVFTAVCLAPAGAELKASLKSRQ